MTIPSSDAHSVLTAQRDHLSNLLEAIQRCVYFLDASDSSLSWPLSGGQLLAHKKDTGLFEALAAVNERFAKLQDTLGSAMRHTLLLSGEQAESFLRVLAIFEKNGVLISLEDWQTTRSARNLAAHDYETDYSVVAEHFNALHGLKPTLLGVAARFMHYCSHELKVMPCTADFAEDFARVTGGDGSRV